MAIPRLSLNIDKLMELQKLGLKLKKSNDDNVLQKRILQKSFDNKMMNLSLTPRPSKPKRLNEELISNYHHVQIAKTMQIKHQYHQPLRALNTPKPTPQPSPIMQPSSYATQQAFKAQLNQLIERDLAVQKKLSKEKLAKKALEEKMVQMECMTRMGM